ncbi:MAG: hypothetical protein IKV67_11540, partial [Paludibacteraceae bacterium]|nr:hypothetical protein [Paludibacteraceae bacterium]
TIENNTVYYVRLHLEHVGCHWHSSPWRKVTVLKYGSFGSVSGKIECKETKVTLTPEANADICEMQNNNKIRWSYIKKYRDGRKENVTIDKNNVTCSDGKLTVSYRFPNDDFDNITYMFVAEFVGDDGCISEVKSEEFSVAKSTEYYISGPSRVVSCSKADYKLVNRTDNTPIHCTDCSVEWKYIYENGTVNTKNSSSSMSVFSPVINDNSSFKIRAFVTESGCEAMYETEGYSEVVDPILSVDGASEISMCETLTLRAKAMAEFTAGTPEDVIDSYRQIKWFSATSVDGPFTEIAGQTGKEYSPLLESVGTYYFKVQIFNYNTAENDPSDICAKEYIHKVVVSNVGKISLVANAVEVCEGENITVEFKSAISNNFTTVWKLNDNQVVASGNKLVISNPGSYKLDFTATTNTGCKYERSLTFRINKNPEFTLTEDTVCSQKEVYFSLNKTAAGDEEIIKDLTNKSQKGTHGFAYYDRHMDNKLGISTSADDISDYKPYDNTPATQKFKEIVSYINYLLASKQMNIDSELISHNSFIHGQIANNRGGVLGGQYLVVADQIQNLLVERFGQEEIDAVYWSLYNDGDQSDPSIFIMVNAAQNGKYASELSCVKYVTIHESSLQQAYTVGEQSTQRIGWYIFGTKDGEYQDAPFTDGLISDAEYVRSMYDPSQMSPVVENRGFKVSATVSNVEAGDYFDYTWDNEPGKPWGSSSSMHAYIFSDICDGNIPYSLTVVNRRTLCHTTKSASLPIKLGDLSVTDGNGVSYNVLKKDANLTASAKKIADVEATMSDGCKVTAPSVMPLTAALSCNGIDIVGTPEWTQSPEAGTEVANGAQITLTVKYTTVSECEVEKKVDAYYIVKVPNAMSLTDVANAKVCENETYAAAFSVEHGTPGYTVSGIPAGATSTISGNNVTVNVPAGTYNLTVTDKVGCSAHVAFKVDEIVVDKPEILFTPVCDDQTVDLAVKNPDNTKYTYSWSLVSPTSSSNPSVTGLTNASSGNRYKLTASAKELPTSNVACKKESDIVELTFKAKPILALSASNPSGTSVCPIESGSYALGVVASNTDSNESYVWSVTGGTLDKNDTDNVNFTPSNRCSGNVTYEVLVENGNGCQSRASGSFAIKTGDLSYSLSDDLKTVELTSTQCQFLVPNFVGSASYNIATSSCGNNISYTQSIDPATPVYSSTSVTVTAKDFCHADGVDQVINLVVPTPISIENVSSTSVKCKGDGDGTITIGNIVGGKETYHYFYKKASDDDFTEVNEKTVSSLIAGDYVLRVVDANGCYYNKNINVSEPSIVTLTATPTNAECHGSKGKITVAANGGNGGTYIYKYGTASDNIDTQFTSDSELPANKYYVQAFDVKGCKSAVVDVTITQPVEFNPGTIESAGQTICYGSPVNAIKSAATAT